MPGNGINRLRVAEITKKKLSGKALSKALEVMNKIPKKKKK